MRGVVENLFANYKQYHLMLLNIKEKWYDLIEKKKPLFVLIVSKMI